MDLLILLDSSGSVRDRQIPNTTDNWQVTLNFVKEVIRSGSKVGRYYDRIALILFSNTVELKFDFNAYSSLADVLAAVDRLPYLGLTTDTPWALDLGRRVFMNDTYGSRPNATHIMLLITDLYNEPDVDWRGRFTGNVTLLNNATDIKRFRKHTHC